MRWHGSLICLALVTTTGFAQQSPTATKAEPPLCASPSLIAEPVADHSISTWDANQIDRRDGFLTGNHNFPNFIGYMSNPLFAIDPRAITEAYPLFESVSIKSLPALPNGNIQLYGSGLNLAVTEDLSIGLNQGGYAVSNFQRRQRDTFLTDRILRLNRDNGGSRDGWLNLGGFVQYTLIQDVPDQFLLTAGLHWEAPSGESEVFQGHGPAKLAPYITVGKEFNDFHILATTGYLFPTGSAPLDNLFYGSVHLDRRMFGWFYPLIEANWAYHSSSVNLNVPQLPNFFDFGTFEGSGNVVSLAAGFNAVLVPEKLEFGGVYTTSVATQHDFSFSGVLLKMVIRY